MDIIYYKDCVPDLQLFIDIPSVALRCFSNAQQREMCTPFRDIVASIVNSTNSLNFDLLT